MFLEIDSEYLFLLPELLLRAPASSADRIWLNNAEIPYTSILSAFFGLACLFSQTEFVRTSGRPHVDSSAQCAVLGTARVACQRSSHTVGIDMRMSCFAIVPV